MAIKGFGFEPMAWTAGGSPKCDSIVIEALAGKDPINGKYGKAYEQLAARGQEQEGIEMSIALDCWLKFKHIDKLTNTYIKPLQHQIDKHGRIHCSMNLNTETGRISCKKPNL